MNISKLPNAPFKPISIVIETQAEFDALKELVAQATPRHRYPDHAEFINALTLKGRFRALLEGVS